MLADWSPALSVQLPGTEEACFEDEKLWAICSFVSRCWLRSHALAQLCFGKEPACFDPSGLHGTPNETRTPGVPGLRALSAEVCSRLEDIQRVVQMCGPGALARHLAGAQTARKTLSSNGPTRRIGCSRTHRLLSPPSLR